MIYGISLSTSGNSSTCSAAGNEVDHVFIKPGARNVGLQAMYIVGKAAGLTAISGIVIRVRNYTTASSAGSNITPSKKDPGMQAATATVNTSPAVGTPGLTHLTFGCGAAGPGGWVAPNPDSIIYAQGSGANSTDALSASGTASLNFEWSGEIVE